MILILRALIACAIWFLRGLYLFKRHNGTFRSRSNATGNAQTSRFATHMTPRVQRGYAAPCLCSPQCARRKVLLPVSTEFALASWSSQIRAFARTMPAERASQQQGRDEVIGARCLPMHVMANSAGCALIIDARRTTRYAVAPRRCCTLRRCPKRRRGVCAPTGSGALAFCGRGLWCARPMWCTPVATFCFRPRRPRKSR